MRDLEKNMFLFEGNEEKIVQSVEKLKQNKKKQKQELDEEER